MKVLRKIEAQFKHFQKAPILELDISYSNSMVSLETIEFFATDHILLVVNARFMI